MGLKIVTGGTTDAADGTLVSSGNHFVFAAVDTVLDLHLRCDDDTYSADQTISLPSDGDVEISFDGGSTWKDYADSPANVVTGIGIGGLDVGDLNFPIKLRQHASTASTAGQISSDGTFSACTALADVTSFVATPGGTQVALSWAAVTNRTYYRIDRALDAGFTSGVALDISPLLTATSLTDTGLTNGVTYYYRIKAVGTYRYKDSASYATANATPPLLVGDTFAGTDGTLLTAHTPTDSAGAWTSVYAPNANVAKLLSGRVSAWGGTATSIMQLDLSQSQAADCATEADIYVATADTGYILVTARTIGAYAAETGYRAWLSHAGVLSLDKMVAGANTLLGTYSGSALSAASSHTVRLECTGTAIKAYLNGVLRISVTDSSVTAAGTKIGLQIYNTNTSSGGTTSLHLDALRSY